MSDVEALVEPRAAEQGIAASAARNGFAAAINSVAYDDARRISIWMLLGYVFLLPVPWLRFSAGTAFPLTVLQAGVLLVLLVLRIGLAGRRIPPRRAHAALAALLGVAMFDLLVRSYLSYAGDRTAGFYLLMIAAGLFCLSVRWLTLLLSAAVGGWGLLVFLTPGRDPTLGGSILPLATTLAIAILARTARAGAVKHVERLRRQDARHLREAREGEAKFHGIVNRIRDVFICTDLEGTIQMVSPSIERFGFRVADVIGANVGAFYADPEDREQIRRVLFERRQVADYEVQFRRGDGGFVTVTVSVNLICDEYGEPVGIEGLAHDISDRKREEVRQREEMREASAMARVGQELIASLDEPALLDRLCRLTTEVFESDAAHTFLIRPGGIEIAAGYGDTPEQWESLRALEIPKAMVEPVLSRLRSDGVVWALAEDSHGEAVRPIPPGYGVTLALYFPLRRGEEIVGIQSAAYRGRRVLLDEQRLHLAVSVAHLASLVLETVRLVDELERANRFKTQFLANMSHELRTPLNVIIGYNGMLLEGECGSLTGDQEVLLKRVEGNAIELLNLVDAALELSREETRDIPVEIQEVAVAPLIEELLEEHRAVMTGREVELRFDAPVPLPPLQTDLRKLKMILKNLIDNAIKFTPSGRVSVEVEPRDAGLEFRVCDTGVGILPEDRDLIFDPFRQGATPQGSLEGVGLGLYVVRRLVTVLGGRVDVESEPGRGATFRVWAPLDTSEADASGFAEKGGLTVPSTRH